MSHQFVSRMFGLALLLGLCLTFVPRAQADRLLVMSDGTRALHAEGTQPAVDLKHANILKGPGGITWRVVYADEMNASGNGFDNATLGENRRALFAAVLLKIDSILNHTATVDVLVQPSVNNPALEFNSSGGSYFDSVSGFDDPDSFVVITTGADPFPTFYDMLIQVNFGHPFNESLDEPQPGEIDFVASMLAAVMHGMGILNLTDENGGSTALGGLDTRATFEKFLVNGFGQRLFAPDGQFLGEPGWLIGGAGGVHFRGNNASVHFPLDRIPLFTPDPFDDQLSYLKWKFGPLTADATVVQGGPKGSDNRRVRSWERAVLADLGYQVIYDETDTRAGDWVMALE